MAALRILATALGGALLCGCAHAPERYPCEPAIGEAVTAHVVPSSAAVAAATLNSIGHRSLVVLSLRSAAEAQRCSNELLDAQIFTDARSVKAFFPEASYGLASISGVVSGPYTITVGTTCDWAGWGAQADAAAVSAGVDLSPYDVRFYVLPNETASMCPGGAGYIDGSQAWIRGDACDSKFVYAHELGHSFDSGHAGTPESEYGDLSSAMGGIFDGLVDPPTYAAMFNAMPHLTAPQKIYLGWLPPSNVQTVTTGGRYRVSLLETARSDIQALKIAGEYSTYYVSTRRAVGFDSSLLPTYADKTSIHTFEGEGSTLRGLLGDGQSFCTRKGFTITQLRHDATYAYYHISFP